MDDLTKKQKGFVKDYIETGNATESAERNYDVANRNVANNIGAENLAKPSIINAIKSIADKIPNELLEKVHLEGLEATNEKGADYAVRHKYLDTAYKIKKLYDEGGQRDINIIMPVLVKFLDKKDESTGDNRNSD